jgi:hypothetical protein
VHHVSGWQNSNSCTWKARRQPHKSGVVPSPANDRSRMLTGAGASGSYCQIAVTPLYLNQGSTATVWARIRRNRIWRVTSKLLHIALRTNGFRLHALSLTYLILPRSNAHRCWKGNTSAAISKSAS